MKTKKPTVIDFFCGAGGFTEGFRQQDFNIVMGVDNWKPAVETHNLNHGLSDQPLDVLELSSSIIKMATLPEVDVIIGSPPCTLFSTSNNSGLADKALGIKLIEAYFKIIAYKKNKPNSKLKAWLMENVPNSRKYIKNFYTFNELGLNEWAATLGKSGSEIALNIGDGHILNAGDYGAPQRRERFVCGEVFKIGKFPIPEKTYGISTRPYLALGQIKRVMPPPNIKSSNKKKWTDPNYPSIKLPISKITDQFYDSGIYSVEWKKARYLKINHPFMGRMSFPEDENKPSRTVMATRSCTSRESIIYESEFKRKGDGQFRIPTIREISTLMGFPYSYQFMGSEQVKWRLVGNAVCPHMSFALGKALKSAMGLKVKQKPIIRLSGLEDKIKQINNLNNFKQSLLNKPPKILVQPKFRMHPFKGGNMTVTLTNFNPIKEKQGASYNQWYSSVFLGTGKDFRIKVLPRNKFKQIGKIISNSYESVGLDFIKKFNQKFDSIADKYLKQELFPGDPSSSDVRLKIQSLVEDIAEFISEHQPEAQHTVVNNSLVGKKTVPARQLYAMYAINRLASRV